MEFEDKIGERCGDSRQSTIKIMRKSEDEDELKKGKVVSLVNDLLF
jgi:hypothetical protein